MAPRSTRNVAYCLIAASLLLQGCAAVAVADAAVGTTVFVAKTAVKGTIGAGKLVYRGGNAVGNAVAGNTNQYSDRPYDGGPSGQVGPSCLMPDGSYLSASIGADGSYYCTG